MNRSIRWGAGYILTICSFSHFELSHQKDSNFIFAHHPSLKSTGSSPLQNPILPSKPLWSLTAHHRIICVHILRRFSFIYTTSKNEYQSNRSIGRSSGFRCVKRNTSRSYMADGEGVLGSHEPTGVDQCKCIQDNWQCWYRRDQSSIEVRQVPE